MKKKDFKLIGSIHMISNLNLAIYLLLIIIGVVFAIEHNLQFLIIFMGIMFLYFITVILNIIAAKKLTLIDFKGTSKNIAKNAYKYSFWFFFPFIFTFVIQNVRQAMWDYYTKSKTQHLNKESDIARLNIELLSELKEDGYISQYSYNKQKPMLKETLNHLLKIEEQRKKEEIKSSKQDNLSKNEKDILKWD